MSILDDDSSGAAGGADEQSIHDFMFSDRAVDAEVVDSVNPESPESPEHAPEHVGTDSPSGKKKSTGFNIKWVIGGILAVGLIATVGKMVGGKGGEAVSEPVQTASVNGGAATQTLPAELDGAIDAPAPAPAPVEAVAGEAKPAEQMVPAPAVTADPAVKTETPIESNATPALQNKVAGLEKEVDSLKEQIAGLHQMVSDRNTIASHQQKSHKPKRVSKPNVASKSQVALPVAQVAAAPAVVTQAASAEPVYVAPAKRYTLRGIVYGQAAVERNGALLYVREGDPIGETRVSSIDPVAMEVRLANGVTIK